VGDTLLCGEKGENLSGGRYSVVCLERGEAELWAIILCAKRGDKLSGGRNNVLC